MIVYLVLALIAASAALTVVAVAELLPARPRTLTRQLSAIEELRRGGPRVAAERRTRSTMERLAGLLARLGRPNRRREKRAATIRELLVQAGYRRPEATSVFWGARVATGVAVPLAGVAGAAFMGGAPSAILLAAIWCGLVGWMAPRLFLLVRARARRREIDRNLPDALDLLVVCVEAGLGLNQALARVAEEIRHFSTATSDELVLVNREMRAGVPREEALRALGTRMGVADLRGLATMLIQADRFGTAISQALRVHADTARTRRRQRAEEAAAKTTIKLIFPIVLCVFPAVFVVVLGPAIIGFIRSMAGM